MWFIETSIYPLQAKKQIRQDSAEPNSPSREYVLHADWNDPVPGIQWQEVCRLLLNPWNAELPMTSRLMAPGLFIGCLISDGYRID
jgi:hypothetical protein